MARPRHTWWYVLSSGDTKYFIVSLLRHNDHHCLDKFIRFAKWWSSLSPFSVWKLYKEKPSLIHNLVTLKYSSCWKGDINISLFPLLASLKKYEFTLQNTFAVFQPIGAVITVCYLMLRLPHFWPQRTCVRKLLSPCTLTPVRSLCAVWNDKKPQAYPTHFLSQTWTQPFLQGALILVVTAAFCIPFFNVNKNGNLDN